MRKELEALRGTVLIVGSVTYAFKARKLLLRAGIEAKLIKVSSTESGTGCNHAIEISLDDFYSAVAILRENAVEYSVLSK